MPAGSIESPAFTTAPALRPSKPVHSPTDDPTYSSRNHLFPDVVAPVPQIAHSYTLQHAITPILQPPPLSPSTSTTGPVTCPTSIVADENSPHLPAGEVQTMGHESIPGQQVNIVPGRRPRARPRKNLLNNNGEHVTRKSLSEHARYPACRPRGRPRKKPDLAEGSCSR